MPFHTILIANRGEIACRVIRTARRLGYRTVAVFSDADSSAPHVAMADEAVRIGPAAAAQSYLSIDRLLDAARRTGANAVHPGYGFLSERADFADACIAAGLVFIGPPADAIRAMGDKAGAKSRMLAAGVPCARGYLGDDDSDARLAAEAVRLGVPLLVKAVAGGGGRGMRLVRDLADLAEAVSAARREAINAFGDGRLMLERLIEHGRHIEIQVFADTHGHAIHLGERDCTAQRRRQKVIEEAPSPIVDADLRKRMGSDAVAAALAVGYQGAGTVEFIVDAEGHHFFLEMNTRLQVEHPVTECITGLDLVEWQLRIAAGEDLPLTQDEVRFDGHAIEVRLYAEDPTQGFAPQTGAVLHWRPEAGLAGREIVAGRVGGVRVDDGIAEGSVVSPFYDPMVAKLVAHGRDRADAIRRLIALIEDAPLIGPRNNGRFLRDLLDHPSFRSAQMHTGLLDAWSARGDAIVQEPAADDRLWCLAAALLVGGSEAGHEQAGRHTPGRGRPASVASWGVAMACRRSGPAVRRTLRLAVERDAIVVAVDGQTFRIEHLQLHDHRLRAMIDGIEHRRMAVIEPDAAGDPNASTVHLVDDAAVFSFTEVSPRPMVDRADDTRLCRAPVAGTVAALPIQVGDAVHRGDPLVCVEAMKMEMWIRAAADGRVVAIHVGLKDSVSTGTVLVELEPIATD